MYGHNKILAVIPARGGSKGVPNKNIKELLGKPLIAYTIEQARNSKYIDRTIVSTDSPAIAVIAKSCGAEVPFLRPGELATDQSGTLDVLVHTIDWLEKNESYNFDILVLLHATTPLRDPEDIDHSIELLVEKGAENVFSVTEAHRNPYFNMVEVRNNKVSLVKEGNYTSRQMAPEVFDMNSSIYVWWRDVFIKKKSVFLENSRVYIMPRTRSVDIDDAFDFKIAEMLLTDQGSNVP
jgi:N-acylneuraminate cytidylyltransferase/CMP-N,N'-diacetyllegionaminic acid synthase